MTTPFQSPFAVPDSDVEAAELAAAQLAEYSKWEAVSTIMHGNAIAYHEGHPVPVSNVNRLGYARQGLVRLSHPFIERNPEDADVKTFMKFGEKHKDHPDVRAYKRYLDERKAAEEANPAVVNPFADGSADEDAPADDTSSTADDGKPAAKPASKSAAAKESTSGGRTAANANAEG